MLWQAVTLWLVNRAAGSGQSGTTGVQPEGDHEMRITQSDSDRVQRIRVKPGTCSQSEVSQTSPTTLLARGCKLWHRLAPGRRYGARRSPLSEFMSLQQSLKLMTNSGPLLRIKWEIYFHKEVFRSFIEVINYHWLCFCLYLYYGYTTLNSDFNLPWELYTLCPCAKI